MRPSRQVWVESLTEKVTVSWSGLCWERLDQSDGSVKSEGESLSNEWEGPCRASKAHGLLACHFSTWSVLEAPYVNDRVYGIATMRWSKGVTGDAGSRPRGGSNGVGPRRSNGFIDPSGSSSRLP